jgi:hypothetical protein
VKGFGSLAASPSNLLYLAVFREASAFAGWLHCFILITYSYLIESNLQIFFAQLPA